MAQKQPIPIPIPIPTPTPTSLKIFSILLIWLQEFDQEDELETVVPKMSVGGKKVIILIGRGGCGMKATLHNSQPTMKQVKEN